MASTRAWLTYNQERFPFVVYALLIGGFSSSGVALTGAWSWFAFLWSSVGLVVFFSTLRLMDEYKDYDKDVVANPLRPLPRGLISLSDAKETILWLVFSMLGFALLTAIFFNATAALCYLGLTLHLWLMYCEFYAGVWLQNRPLLYAMTHQASLIWLCCFPVLLMSPEYTSQPRMYAFSGLGLGSFFCYEVCRKLDPKAPAILKTYRQIYGVFGSFLVVGGALFLAGKAAIFLDLGLYLIPVEASVLLAFFFLRLERGHKILEALASVSLALHLWAPFVLFTWWR